MAAPPQNGAIAGLRQPVSIAMQLTDCAMTGNALFDDIKYLKSVTAEDVYKKILKIDTENSVLSVISPKE